MTALEKWKSDFKGFISELSMPEDDYNGIMEYIDEVPSEALEQQPCEDLINQRANTCRHGGHCEWVACDKCNHYESDSLSQQPCEDCISRQEAINCVTSNEFRYKIVEDIKTLPSVTPKEKTGWIPVSERLPEEKQSVLVWCPLYKNIYCAHLEKGQWWIFGAFVQIVPNEVIAWMSLPKPYKAESEDKECR